MIVSIMQPAYLPWLGYFDRISKSDLHIILDDVAMDNDSKTKFTNRNKIRTPNSWNWLTVPIYGTGKARHNPINQIEISSDKNWRVKHNNTIRLNYSKAPFYSRFSNFFDELYGQNWTHLNPMINQINGFFLDELGIKTDSISSSKFSLKSRKSQLILDLCRQVGASTYLSGPFGRSYLNLSNFETAGITVEFHDYAHPTYEQNFEGFEPYMSIIDLMLNHGNKSLDILQT